MPNTQRPETMTQISAEGFRLDNELIHHKTEPLVTLADPEMVASEVFAYGYRWSGGFSIPVREEIDQSGLGYTLWQNFFTFTAIADNILPLAQACLDTPADIVSKETPRVRVGTTFIIPQEAFIRVWMMNKARAEQLATGGGDKAERLRVAEQEWQERQGIPMLKVDPGGSQEIGVAAGFKDVLTNPYPNQERYASEFHCTLTNGLTPNDAIMLSDHSSNGTARMLPNLPTYQAA